MEEDKLRILALATDVAGAKQEFAEGYRLAQAIKAKPRAWVVLVWFEYERRDGQHDSDAVTMVRAGESSLTLTWRQYSQVRKVLNELVTAGEAEYNQYGYWISPETARVIEEQLDKEQEENHG